MSDKRVPRIAFYSHDTMGLGHIRRNTLLTSSILHALPDAEILLISGVQEAGSFYLPKGADIITLPTYLKTPTGKYCPRSLGQDLSRLIALRASTLRAALSTFQPDIFIVDNVPRGAMSELDDVLPLLAANNSHLVLGLRDILDEPAVVQRQWDKQDNIQTIRRYFSSIWIYGDQSFYDLCEQYYFDSETRQKVCFMGYLDARRRPRQAALPSAILPGIVQPYALCIVGGGQDGFNLAASFAKASFAKGSMGVLITGSMMPAEQRESLHQLAAGRSDLLVVRFVAEPLELLRQAQCVVAMGGYNTTIEILSFHKRALIVPRVSPRQEQWIRASRLAQRGLIDCLHPTQLTLSALNHWLQADSTPVDPRQTLKFNGLETFTKQIQQILSFRNITEKMPHEVLNAS